MALEISLLGFSFLLGFFFPICFAYALPSHQQYQISIAALFLGLLGFFFSLYFDLRGVDYFVVNFLSVHLFCIIGLGLLALSLKGDLAFSLVYLVFFGLMYFATKDSFSWMWKSWLLLFLFTSVTFLYKDLSTNKPTAERLDPKGFLTILGVLFAIVKFFGLLFEFLILCRF